MKSLTRPNIDICILIPVLNEAENIEELIHRLQKSLISMNYLLVFIDDGSSDKTVDKILKHKETGNIVLLEREKKLAGCQRGGALYYGLSQMYKNHKVNYWIEMDGDLSHQPEEIKFALASIIGAKADILIISKYLQGSYTKKRGAIREFISLVNSILFRLSFSMSITDYSNGFRIYNSNAAEYILNKKIKYTTPIYLGEVLVYWLKAKMKIIEIPGKYIGRRKGKSQVILKDILEGLTGYFYLIKIYYGKA